MRYRILPYRQGSKSAKALANALGGKVLKLEGSAYKPRPGDTVINWGKADGLPPGFTTTLNLPVCDVLNDPNDIRNASNKLKFFRMMRDAGKSDLIPPFWESGNDIPPEAYPIVCRTTLAGHSGDGIVIAVTPDDLVNAPLYVKYIKKLDEYRVHIGKKNDVFTTIAVQRKARRTDVPSDAVNWQIRNHCNGFIFVRQGVNPPQSIIGAARDALGCSGLDFGAVDVIWNAQQEKAYVLEINTAPGLEGQTVEDYANFFKWAV